ncbi:MAG: hypothetical protein ACKOSO_07055, partial [Actinomycetota bacterium]
AKTVGAVDQLREAGVPYVSILAHPTTGGVIASFASLGDIVIAEPNALLSFAGPRVVEQTTGEKTAPDFGRAESNLRLGQLDAVVPRRELRAELAVRVRAQVDESERVGGAQVGPDLLEGAGVDDLVDALERPHREVVAALRADAQRVPQLVVAVVRAAGRARVGVPPSRVVIPLGALDVDLDRGHQPRRSSKRSITRHALCPPNPKPLEIATSMRCSRAVFGT